VLLADPDGNKFCDQQTAEGAGRRSRGVHRLGRATDRRPAVARREAGRWLCAARAGLPGFCQRHRRCVRPRIPGLSPSGLGPHLTSSGSPAGFPPVSRLPAGFFPSPAVSGFPSSGVLRFVPFSRCRVPVLRRFPSGFPSPRANLHLGAARGGSAGVRAYRAGAQRRTAGSTGSALSLTGTAAGSSSGHGKHCRA
jgi:hypothetical protein